MPQYQKLLDLDEMFHSSKTDPIILNDLFSKTEEDRNYFNNLVSETFTSDVVSVMPKCHCGALKGEYLIGEKCDACNTEVRQSIEEDVSPTLWFRRPQTVEKLINPIVLIMLDMRFTKSKFRIIQWLIDRNYSPAIKKPPIVEQMILDGIPRGYNAFVQNFDSIMQYLFSNKEFELRRQTLGFLVDMLQLTHPSGDPLQQLLYDNRAILFSDYIPLMNRSLLVLEQAATGIYLDNTILDIKDALNTMLSIDQDYFNRTPVVVENRTAKILIMLTDYYQSMFKKNLNPKEGLFRKHGYGTRTNHTFRAVITSHEEIADHDEVWIPWCVSMTVFQLHILNRLMDRTKPYGGMTHNKALEFLYAHIYKYNDMLHEIVQALIDEAKPGPGIHCILQRNPSLMQGSAQLVRITHVKKNPKDTTVSMNDLVAVALNADYDGDETNFMLATDAKMVELFYPFSPFFNLLLLDKPYQISRNASIPDPIIASTSEWIARGQVA